MTLETETVLDRRHLRRALSFWRIAAVAAAVLAIGALARWGAGDRTFTGSRTHQIARVTIEGMITESRDQLRMLQRIADADHVDALILFINSPGGTTTGGEALFEAIRAVFGDGCPDTHINNTKSFIGHCMGAAGALELAGNLPSFEDGWIHPNHC